MRGDWRGIGVAGLVRAKWALDLRALPWPRVRERPPAPGLCAGSLAFGRSPTRVCEASMGLFEARY